MSKNEEPESIRERTTSDEVFLLPGGQWDPSLSTISKSSTRVTPPRGLRRVLSKIGRDQDQSEREGLYQPPAVLPSRVLPTFDDFGLLRTVGRGAFGKVINICVCVTTTLHI